MTGRDVPYVHALDSSYSSFEKSDCESFEHDESEYEAWNGGGRIEDSDVGEASARPRVIF